MDQLHATLFESYKRELAAARDVALRRYAGRLQTWTRQLGSEARAQERMASEQPACVDMRVIAVLRKYWLACDALNEKLGDRGIEPIVFMTEHLEARSPDLAAFLSELPYWPIGKDKKGRWV